MSASLSDCFVEERRLWRDDVARRDRRIEWLETLLSIANEEIGALREKLAHAERSR